MSWPQFDFGSCPGYQQVFDYSGRTDGNPVYIGWATPGVATSAAKWKIRKFTYDASGFVTNIQYANADVGFTNIWDNRGSITFS